MFAPAKFFETDLMFVCNVGSLPLRCSNRDKLCLPSEILSLPEKNTMDKNSSLFACGVIHKEKSFITLPTGVIAKKTFFLSN